MIAYGGKRSTCAPAWREIEAAAATSILDTTLSSQVWSIVRLLSCCVLCAARRRYSSQNQNLDHLVRGRWTAVRARSLSFPASLLWIPGVLQQQANKAWREKENAFKTNCRQFQGRRKKKNDPPTRRSIFRTMRFGAFFFRPRTSKKKGSKSWSTPVCDCLEKETKTVILSDNSNEPELRARSDEATTTRCRKPKGRKGETSSQETERRNFFACASAARAPPSWSIDHHAHLACTSNLVIGSKTSRDLSPFLTSCKPFFAHARSQRMGFDDYGIRDRFLRAKMSNENNSIMVCPPPQAQKESDLEKEARFLANPFSSFPIFYLSKPNEPKLSFDMSGSTNRVQ